MADTAITVAKLPVLGQQRVVSIVEVCNLAFLNKSKACQSFVLCIQSRLSGQHSRHMSVRSILNQQLASNSDIPRVTESMDLRGSNHSPQLGNVIIKSRDLVKSGGQKVISLILNVRLIELGPPEYFVRLLSLSSMSMVSEQTTAHALSIPTHESSMLAIL